MQWCVVRLYCLSGTRTLPYSGNPTSHPIRETAFSATGNPLNLRILAGGFFRNAAQPSYSAWTEPRCRPFFDVMAFYLSADKFALPSSGLANSTTNTNENAIGGKNLQTIHREKGPPPTKLKTYTQEIPNGHKIRPPIATPKPSLRAQRWPTAMA